MMAGGTRRESLIARFPAAARGFSCMTAVRYLALGEDSGLFAITRITARQNKMGGAMGAHAMTAQRNVLARCSLLTASLFALCNTHALAADLVRVGKASATTFAFAPIDIGKEKGIWAKYNLDVESI